MPKSELDIQTYKRMYYLHNKKKLLEYSKNYYCYKKCKGDFTNEEISENMKKFLASYKKHNSKKEPTPIKIKRGEIKISFN